MNNTQSLETGIDLYNKAAHESASVVISQYSTSFGWATSLLPDGVRGKIKDIYALVRVADEIVDGSAAAANRSSRAAQLPASTNTVRSAGSSTVTSV